jgi:transaldolase/glucose-6-phosphate isomerase
LANPSRIVKAPSFGLKHMNAIKQVHELGQSIWLDFIRRDLLTNGQLAGLIEAGELRGMTSNPTIFEEAIARSDLYNDAIRPLAQAGWEPELIFESLAVDDVRAASDLFLVLYEGSDGKDGFVSIEVSPRLADDTQGTLEEARRLWESVNRPNLMVKIPATEGGVPAIEQAIFEGINVNVTLVFSLERYSQVMEAYLRGLERRVEAGQPIDRVASVASFFVSRVDTAVDGKLEAILRDEGAHSQKALALLGKAAIANAKLAYAQFKAAFGNPRFSRLHEVGGRTQRPLWASTSTKNPAYSDVLYVEQLIGRGTVNTLPPNTLNLFRDHGKVELTLEKDLAVARAQLDTLAELGISMEAITQELEADGVRKFAHSFESLLKVVAERASNMQQELGPRAPAMADALKRLDRDRVAGRFWRRDPSLWGESKRGAELAGGLGWLDLDLGELVNRFETLTTDARSKGVRKIGWIGPVGALGAIKAIVGSDSGFEILPLESIDPEELRSFAAGTPIASTLFILAGSESIERAGLELTWQRARAELQDQAGERFIALAAGGSSLEAVARGRAFREIVEMPPELPVLLALLQAALLGGSPSELLRGAVEMRGQSGAGRPAARNPGLQLGAFLAAGAASGVHRIGLVADPPLTALAHWLAAEASARGVGSRLSILSTVPVEMALGDAAMVYLRTSGGLDRAVDEWQEKDAPVLVLQAVSGLAGVGAEAVRWEIGAAIAAHLLEIKPFPPNPTPSQPAKLVKTLQRKRRLDFKKPTWRLPGLSVWSTASRLTLEPKAGVTPVAEAILGRLRPGQTLLLGLYFARGSTTDHSLGRIAVIVGEGQSADCLTWHGRMPRQVRRPGASLSLLLAVDPGIGPELPELGITAGALQLIQAMSDFGRLEESGDEAYLIQFKSLDSAAEFLRIMEVAQQ